MSRLTDLIAQAKTKDAQLGADLEREFRALSSRLSFGLNFERHRPEAVELPLRPIRKGDKVRVLPPRGSTKKGDQRLWLVKKIKSLGHRKEAELELADETKPEVQIVPLDDLVVIAEFNDIIFPGLVSTGQVSRGGSKPWHTVINGENYHVLKALTFTHRGKVDAIYIDPPYNTGAKDWKYNNDYVEGDDLYRHSKWLAMMERRLRVAKELLNPADSVLIVTIDEKEYLRLGLLLEQTFPEARIQMVSSVINPKGVPRDGFARVDEYIFVLQFGSAQIVGDIKEGSGGTEVRWRGLTRTGANGIRSKSPGAFYPIYFDNEGKLVDVGDALPLSQGVGSVSPREGLTAVWPTPRPDGEDGRWSVVPTRLKELIDLGAVKVGRVKPEDGQFPIFYLTSKQLMKIESGELEVKGKTSEGVMRVFYREEKGRVSAPRTVWEKVSHSASEHGSGLLKALLPGRKFPYPKSLYAIEDVLRLSVRDKLQCVILDFFSGSGTTAHAVMRLNKQDGGRRHCISITNNEVAADEQKNLREQSLRPGDPEWEKFGICDYITKPRVAAAISGKTPDGDPIKGDYKFNDEFPMADGFEENAEFFTLTYETPVAVNHNRAFERIAPLLWLRAGCLGRRIEKLPDTGWAVVDAHGLLVELDKATPFMKACRKAEGLRIAFIVTDDERRFQALAQRLPPGVEAIRLYESYLTNFAFANGEDA